MIPKLFYTVFMDIVVKKMYNGQVPCIQLRGEREIIMNYKETGFRGLYKQFSVYPMNKNIKKLVGKYEGVTDGGGILTYGYYDREKGLMLEVLAAATIKEEKVTFEEPVYGRVTISISDVCDEQFSHIDDKDDFLSKKYSEKLSVLKVYAASAKLEATRNVAILDPLRDQVCFDEIKVVFNKNGLEAEECQVRIEEQVEGHFVGSLVSNPKQDFGFYEGDRIVFFVAKEKEGQIFCLADFGPSAFLTEDDLEDGSLLEAAVKKFREQKGEENLMEVLQLIRDSYVWVPCRMLSELNVETDLEQGISPDIFQKGADFFIPMFSSEEQMKEYATARSKYPMHALKVIKMAKESTKPLTGIVLNPFTNPFVLDMKLCEVVEKMKSRVTQ